MRKTQIEITNVMFMHLIGLVGILTFTFLFVSLIAGSSARAEGLREETIYYNYGRRLISTSDCLAYNHIENYYNGVTFESYSRVMPGIIDVSKLFDYNHQNCLRYDFVSGSALADPSNPFATYPVVIYEVNVKDLVNQELYNFTNDVYVSIGTGQAYTMCDPDFVNEQGECLPNDCLPSCQEIDEYNLQTLTNLESTTLSCLDEEEIPQNPIHGENCVYEQYADIARMVESFDDDFNCTMTSIGLETSQAGKVQEFSLQYPVILKYLTNYNNSIEHPGTLNVRFCAIYIPTMCDPFFENTNYGAFGSPVYQPDYCNSLEVPLI